MRKGIFNSKRLPVTIVLLSAILLFASSVYAKPFRGLDDIPQIKNKTPIHVALEAGGSADLIIPYIKKFSEKTGVPVTTESMVMTVIYPKINVELLSGTGAYDITVVEASTTNEWAPFLWSVQELAEKYDPSGVAGLNEDLKGHAPIMLRCASDINGRLMGMPYYTYQQVMFVRQDVLDDPTEKETFKKKYGYDLAAPQTWEQLQDITEFFTRKKGDLLKGQPLTDDLFGSAIMAGRYEINDEMSTRIWSMNHDWTTLIRDANGKPKEFVITKEDKEALKKSLTDYKKMIPFVSPGCLTGFWDYVTAQFAEGKTIIAPHLYVSLDQWGSTVEEKVPGAKIALVPCIGAKGYIGNFHQAVAKASKNPEAAYWLMRYIGSYDCQKEMIEKGWSGVRPDVLYDEKYQAPEWRIKVGNRANVLKQVWNDDFLAWVDNLYYFNADAAGKVYEMQIILCHEAMTDKRTVDKTVDAITQKTIELQSNFGTLPIREEK